MGKIHEGMFHAGGNASRLKRTVLSLAMDGYKFNADRHQVAGVQIPTFIATMCHKAKTSAIWLSKVLLIGSMNSPKPKQLGVLTSACP